MIKKVVILITGDNKSLTLEHRLYNFISFLFVITALAMPFLINGIFKILPITIAFIVYTVNCLFCYLINRTSEHLRYKNYCLVSTAVLIMLFFLFEDVIIGAFAGLIAAFFYAIVLAPSKHLHRFFWYYLLMFPGIFVAKKHITFIPLTTDTMFATHNLIFLSLTCFLLFAGFAYYKFYFDEERKRTKLQNQEIARKNEILEDQKKEIEENSEKKTEFFTHLAHEMRTPITLINNYLKRYLDEKGNNDNYNVIIANVERLLHDVEFYLNSEKLRLGLKLYNHNQVINISKIITDKTKLFKNYTKEKKIKINYTVQEDLTVKADPTAIETVINNIIENAIKFSLPQGEITISLYLDNDKVCFYTEDQGIGISESEHGKIFDRFYQGSSTNVKNSGLGIGLSIVRKILEELNGNISVSSKENSGTKITITFQQYIPENNDEIIDYSVNSLSYVPVNDLQIADSQFKSNRNSILLVEDNKELLAYLGEELSLNYNVFMATCGNEALDKLHHIPKPQLIITDVMMDNLDGFELVEKLSTMEAYCHIPVMILTAKTTIADKHKGLNLGAVDYISKPFSIDELKIKVESILNNAKLQKKELLQRAMLSFMKEFNINLDPKKEDNSVNEFYEQCLTYNLTNREIDIAKSVIVGNTNKEIGNQLSISSKTVAKHVQNIFDKVNTRSRIDLIFKLKSSEAETPSN